jgi:hypothetical protein
MIEDELINLIAINAESLSYKLFQYFFAMIFSVDRFRMVNFIETQGYFGIQVDIIYRLLTGSTGYCSISSSQDGLL